MDDNLFLPPNLLPLPLLPPLPPLHSLAFQGDSFSAASHEWIQGIGFVQQAEGRFEMLQDDDDQLLGDSMRRWNEQQNSLREGMVEVNAKVVLKEQGVRDDQQRREGELEPTNSVALGMETTTTSIAIEMEMTHGFQPETQPSLATPPDLPSKQVQDALQEAFAKLSEENGEGSQLAPKLVLAQHQRSTGPFSLEPPSASFGSQEFIPAIPTAPSAIDPNQDAPSIHESRGVHGDGEKEANDAKPAKNVPFPPQDGGFTMNGKVRVPKNVEFEEDYVLHGIHIKPLASFISTLAPLPLAKVHKILLNSKTPKSHQRIDVRLAAWDTEEVDVREEVPVECMNDKTRELHSVSEGATGPDDQPVASTSTAVNGLGKGMTPATRITNESIENPIIRELRIDISTLHPSALYRLEEFRRRHLSLPELNVDFITYLRWKTITKAEAERLTLQADGPPEIVDSKGKSRPTKKAMEQDQQENGDVMLSTLDAAPMDLETEVFDNTEDCSPLANVHASSGSEFEAPISKRRQSKKVRSGGKRGRPRKNKDNEVEVVDMPLENVAEKADGIDNAAEDYNVLDALQEDFEVATGSLEHATSDAEMAVDDLPEVETSTVEAVNPRAIKPVPVRGRKSAVAETSTRSCSSRRSSSGNLSPKSPVVALRSSMKGKGRQEPPIRPEGGPSVHFPRPNRRRSRSVSFDIPEDKVEVVVSMHNRKRRTSGQRNKVIVKPKETRKRGRPNGNRIDEAREEESAEPTDLKVDQEKSKVTKKKTIVEVVIPIRKRIKLNDFQLGGQHRYPSRMALARDMGEQLPFPAIPYEAAGHADPSPPTNGQSRPGKRRRSNYEGTEPAMSAVVPDHELESEDGYDTSKSRVEEVGPTEVSDAKDEADLDVESDDVSRQSDGSRWSDEWSLLGS